MAKARADVEAGYDTAVDVEERPEMVIEQGVERAVMINLTPVRYLSLWSISADADPLNAPDFVPEWARGMCLEGQWTQLDAICDWVLSLKI